MSSVNYSLKHKGVKLISAKNAWVSSKNGKRKLNPKFNFVGKIDSRLPNIIISASEKGKPKFKGNTHDLCSPAKKQIVEHFLMILEKETVIEWLILVLKKKNLLLNVARNS